MRILETERLRLRWFEPADAGFLLGLLNDPAWISGIRDSGVRTEAGALEWMQNRLIGPCRVHGHGFWLVERRADGERLGLCGVFKRDTLPLPDLGYGFAAQHTGKGYAREAALACLDYAVQALGRHEVLAITSPGNERSEDLLRELGFEAGAVRDGEDGPTRDWTWRSAQAEPADDAARIDALTARFFAAFCNREGRIPTLAALPALFVPDARIEAPGQATCSVREFIEARAALLQGRLTEFSEWELESHTRIEGDRAWRELRYEKAGLLAGQAYGGRGSKTLEFARDGEGRWRIAALSWIDD